MTQEELQDTLNSLAIRRPVFHSEADFQHELAIELVYRGYQVRLEVPKCISLNGEAVNAEIDLLITKGSNWTAIELKYVKKPCTITYEGETFELRGTWGTNLSRFDCLADTQRVEAIIYAGYASAGYSVFLTNVSNAWNSDTSQGNTMAQQLSIHEGRVIEGNTPLNWQPINPNVGSVSRKRLAPYAPITLRSNRIVQWKDYSSFELPNGAFKYLVL